MQRFQFSSVVRLRWVLGLAGFAGAALLLGAGMVVAQGAVVAPALAVVSGGGVAHPAAFYVLHNDTSCEVPDAALPVVAVPTRVHLHTLMCEPTEGPEAALPEPTASGSGAGTTANFTPLP